MSALTNEAKKIILRSSDKDEFVVDEAVAMELGIVKSFDENPEASREAIPLPNVSSKALSSIIDYCKAHLIASAPSGDGEEDKASKEFDKELVKSLDNEMLKEMILAANYLDIKGLLDMLNQAAADRIANRSVEYVRRFFGIQGDYTEEEEDKLRAEHSWAFEDVDPDD